MANAFVTGAVRLTMPAVLRVEVDGALPAGVTAKDLVLHLLALPSIRAGAGVGKVFEFGGVGGARAGHRRARDADQHDGRTRRLHRHRRARRRNGALPEASGAASTSRSNRG